MPINNPPRGVQGGSGLALPVDASGVVVVHRGQVFVREIFGGPGTTVENGNGVHGPIIVRAPLQGLIARGTIQAHVAGGIHMKIERVEEIEDVTVVLGFPSAVPDPICRIGVSALPDGDGIELMPPTYDLSALTKARSRIPHNAALSEIIKPAHIYAWVEVPNPTPLTLEVIVLGRVIKQGVL